MSTRFITTLPSRHVSLDNSLIMSGWELGLVERRVIFLVLSGVDSSKEVSSTEWYGLHIKDYAEMCGITDTKNAYQIVREGLVNLFNKVIEIPLNEKKTRIRKFRWIQSMEYDEVEHIVKLKWSDDIIPYISELRKNFTCYRNSCVLPIDSKYTFRLYMLLEAERYRGHFGEIEITLSTIYIAWNIPKSLQEFRYFKRDVLDKAIKELAELKIALVEIVKYVKEGRKVSRIVLKYGLERLDERKFIRSC